MAQSKGKKPDRNARKRKAQEKIDEASDESFPASDPPSWSPAEPGSPHNGKDRDKARPDPSRR